MVPLLLSLLAAGSFTACHKDNRVDGADAGPNAGSLKQSYDALKAQVDTLTTRFSGLQKQVDALPANLDGLRDLRGKLFTAEEVLGVSSAKLTWLSGQLDSALQTQKPEQLQQISKALAATTKDVQQVDHVGLELTHRLVSFERTAALLQNPADVRASAK